MNCDKHRCMFHGTNVCDQRKATMVTCFTANPNAKRQDQQMNPTHQKIKEILFETLTLGDLYDIDTVADIKPEHELADDLAADSLDQIELTMALEEGFDCKISDAAAEKMVTVQDIFDYADAEGF